MLLFGIPYIEGEWAKYHFIESPKQYPLSVSGLFPFNPHERMLNNTFILATLQHTHSHTFTIHTSNIQSRRPWRHAPFMDIIGTEGTPFP